MERHSAAISDRALRVLRALAEASPPFRPRLFASSLLSSPFRMGLKFSSFTSPHFFRRIFVHRPPKKTTYTASKASQMYAGMNTCHQSMSARFVSFNMISATCEHPNTVIRITCNQKGRLSASLLWISVPLFRRPAWFPHQVDDAVSLRAHASPADAIDLCPCADAVVVELAAIIIAHDHRQCVITFFPATQKSLGARPRLFCVSSFYTGGSFMKLLGWGISGRNHLSKGSRYHNTTSPIFKTGHFVT